MLPSNMKPRSSMNSYSLLLSDSNSSISFNQDLDSMAKCIEYRENVAFSNGRYGQSESAVSGSRSDYDSQSAENGREEDSSNSSDGNMNQESCATKRRSYEQHPCKIPIPKQEDPSLSTPDIILNFGLSRKGSLKVRFKRIASGVSPVVVMDESEVTKEKKKKSNRLSLRKQQECERLEAEAMELKMKNSMLKDELIRLSGECMEQENKNNALMENLIKMYGRDAIASLQAKNPDSVFRSINEENDSHRQEA